MNNISFSLIQLEGQIYLSNNAMAQSFYEPLDKTAIDKIFFDNQINDNLLSYLYSWKNGSKYFENGEFWFCSFGYFVPLDNAIEWFNDILLGFKMKKLFPIVMSYRGEYLLLDIDARSANYGKILALAPNILVNEPEVVFDSLHSFIISITECFKSGVYKYNSENVLVVDFEMENALMRTLNENSFFWE